MVVPAGTGRRRLARLVTESPFPVATITTDPAAARVLMSAGIVAGIITAGVAGEVTPATEPGA
jgi:hypothetical protein